MIDFCGKGAMKAVFLSFIGAVGFAAGGAHAQAPEATGSGKSDYCSKFDKNFFEQDIKVQRIQSLNHDDNVIKYSIAPPGEKTLINPATAYRGLDEEPYYRLAFYLIPNREDADFIDDGLNRIPRSKKYRAQNPWSITISNINPDSDAQPLRLTNENTQLLPDKWRPNVSRFDKAGAVPILGPAAGAGNELVIDSTDKAPIVFARYAQILDPKSVPLDSYARDFTPTKAHPFARPCFIRLREMESASVEETKYVYPDAPQDRIDRLTDAMVWLSVDIFAGVERIDDVARRDEGFAVGCTGFRVSATHIMTAGHCVKHLRHCERSLYHVCTVRGWARKRGGDIRVRAPDYQNLKAVIDPNLSIDDRSRLDYAILEISEHERGDGPIAILALDGVANVENLPTVDGDIRLAIPQFPSEREFVLNADRDCILHPDFYVGDGVDKALHFGHLCDTYPGSSGSPVMDRSLQRVYGVHVLGWSSWKYGSEGQPDDGNVAVRLTDIWRDMQLIMRSGEGASSAAAQSILQCQREIAQCAVETNKREAL